MTRKLVVNNYIAVAFVALAIILLIVGLPSGIKNGNVFVALQPALISLIPYLVFVVRGFMLSNTLKKDYPEDGTYRVNFIAYILCLFWVSNLIAIPLLMICSIKLSKNKARYAQL